MFPEFVHRNPKRRNRNRSRARNSSRSRTPVGSSAP
ncbi:hypothetical protein RAM_16555 [Amycolatopsis mediterranei S699]|uniref:Uncharacterized protein n=1 Tax=Amycolatopsis mediterranei (strain S699) TaxID=713604 RepID=A0A9R0U8H4_AMYMS|nr:hypothetical protein RAM_16555 [Amycolatopsis mediterranei S699]